MYRNFQEIVAKAKKIGPRKVAVLFPDDLDVMRAARDGVKEGLIEPVLVGNGLRIEAVANEINLPLKEMEILDQEEPQEAADLCLDMVKTGKVAFVVKGNILTTYLYRALIRTTKQLAPDQAPCTLCFHQVAGINKIFVITDPGVNIRPDLIAKQKTLANATKVLHRLDLYSPHVMALAASSFDKRSDVFFSDARKLRRLGEEGEFGRWKIDTATNLFDILEEGNITTERFPDIFLVPNIETGNILVKSIDHLLGGIRQCVTVGAGLITLTPSRSDGYEARMTNLALGIVLAASGRE